MVGIDTVKISKFLALILRHKPDDAGVTLDEAGWTEVDGLLEGMARAGTAVSFDDTESP